MREGWCTLQYWTIRLCSTNTPRRFLFSSCSVLKPIRKCTARSVFMSSTPLAVPSRRVCSVGQTLLATILFKWMTSGTSGGFESRQPWKFLIKVITEFQWNISFLIDRLMSSACSFMNLLVLTSLYSFTLFLRRNMTGESHQPNIFGQTKWMRQCNRRTSNSKSVWLNTPPRPPEPEPDRRNDRC